MVEGSDLPIDFYRIDDLLTDDEREIRDRVRSFCDKEVLPIINDYWERAEFPFELVSKLARLGIICTFAGVQSGLAMGSVALPARRSSGGGGFQLRLAQLEADGRMTGAMASLAKMNNAAKARQVVAEARDLLGGNGILLSNHVARHQADMEAVSTYEGTDSIQSLIIGRQITGCSAFSAA
ncbi:MAG TPA: acyl-CoA dehydrogenase family protein [Actinomycetes bacterium]|nr:acyl-CoA dehydrogenase family protein [Actinomycetes bacterium]